MEWNDDKAEIVKDLVRVARPGWEVHHEFQAVVSVRLPDDGPVFWFGGSNQEIGADVFENAKGQEAGEMIMSIATTLDRDAAGPMEIHKEIVRQAYNVGLAITTCQEGGWLTVEGYPNDSRLKEFQLELEVKIKAVTDFLQELEEIWAPLTGTAYLAVMGHAAKRFGQMASNAGEAIPNYLSHQEFMEVKD